MTNVPAEWLSREQITLLYRLRWQIELLFELWKSECLLAQTAGRLKARVLCEIYAKLIGATLFQYGAAPFPWTERELRPSKTFQTFPRFSIALAQALHDPRRLEDCRTRLVTVWQQCGMKDQRRTRLSTCQQIARAGALACAYGVIPRAGVAQGALVFVVATLGRPPSSGESPG